jgi:hypothetical protein
MVAGDDRYEVLRLLPPFPAIPTRLLRRLSGDEVPMCQIVDLIKADTAPLPPSYSRW